MATKICCDACGHDITYTCNSRAYRVSLKVETVPIDPETPSVTDVMLTRPFDRDAHFCGQRCLRNWLAGQPDNRP